MPPTPDPGFASVGQVVPKALVRRALSGGRPPSIVITGPPGAGKGAFLEDVTALALCEAETDRRPCNACAGCRGARGRTHPDLVVASPRSWRSDRGATESIVGVARRWLGEVAGAPIAGRWRVIVVEEADKASEQVQNALLKALEEPADRQLFVLVADDADRLLPTIRSRCLQLRLRPVPRADLVAWLVEHEPMTDEQAEVLARMSGGWIGASIAHARAPERVEWRRRTQQELVALLDRGPAERLSAIRELSTDAARLAPSTAEDVEPAPESGGRLNTQAQRAAALAILDVWVDLARDMAVSAAGAPDLAVSGELVPDVATRARRLGEAPLVRVTRTLQRVREAVEHNVSPRLALEVAMLAWPSTQPPPDAAPRLP